jgi:hypothetical protein
VSKGVNVAEIDQRELTLLAAIAYGESYYRKNNFEEMAGIASVMLRQMKCRGYESIQAFTQKEKSFSYVVSDGKPRFNSISNTKESDVQAEMVAATQKLQELDEQIAQKEADIKLASGGDKKGLAQLKVLKSRRKGVEIKKNEADGKDMAYRAARHALEGGVDHSSGAYFWDGWDIKTNYDNHAKVKRGIRFSDPSHNIFDIKEATVVVIRYKKTKETKGTKIAISKVEDWRYDHVYSSTTAHGGTVFWKFNPDYVKFERAKEYL